MKSELLTDGGRLVARTEVTKDMTLYDALMKFLSKDCEVVIESCIDSYADFYFHGEGDHYSLNAAGELISKQGEPIQSYYMTSVAADCSSLESFVHGEEFENSYSQYPAIIECCFLRGGRKFHPSSTYK